MRSVAICRNNFDETGYEFYGSKILAIVTDNIAQNNFLTIEEQIKELILEDIKNYLNIYISKYKNPEDYRKQLMFRSSDSVEVIDRSNNVSIIYIIGPNEEAINLSLHKIVSSNDFNLVFKQCSDKKK